MLELPHCSTPTQLSKSHKALGTVSGITPLPLLRTPPPHFPPLAPPPVITFATSCAPTAGKGRVPTPVVFEPPIGLLRWAGFYLHSAVMELLFGVPNVANSAVSRVSFTLATS